MKRIKLSKKNEKGQMAVFVALIFQILFVFFAMSINIGLVVHDKINLQNAVDFAAYYAAQRQAEMLNVIAHTNYQIRQHWKLLNWRYYVLGTMGFEDPFHPAKANANLSEGAIWPPYADDKAPVMCITYRPTWNLDRTGNDNPCKKTKYSIPNIPDFPIIAPFNPINLIFSAFVRDTQKSISQTCEGYSGINWFYAAMIYNSFVKDQQSRKELIRAIARNLAKDPREMVDLDGDPIYEGAQKTFVKNLTFSNNPNPQSPPQIEIFNSLQGLDPAKWLNDIDVMFTMMYQELTGGGSCQSANKFIFEGPNEKSFSSLQNFTGDTTGEKLNELLAITQMNAKIKPGDSRRVAIGVEKNPWILAYVGVKAKTRPRQLFFPFGEAIEFEAKAFAQPFGGRIGPWYGKAWARGASASSGDSLQLNPAKLNADGSFDKEDLQQVMPQYSKYPGDKVGLRSTLALSSLMNVQNVQASIRDYVDLLQPLGSSGVNDLVAFNRDPKSNIRNFEIAALAPDLFDITYYSIQTNFGDRYLQRLINNRERLGIPAEGYPRGDLGSRGRDNIMSVKDQIAVASGLVNPVDENASASGSTYFKPEAFWYVRSQNHLLTSWVHSDSYGEYSEFPEGRFGKCELTDAGANTAEPGPPPGSCLDRGGRTGFSVKIVSPEIFRSALPLGGPGQSPGVILNPPGEF